jgi:HD-GYP domain-containing protein (c-di-GMP phosphodiesterase class II)
MDRLLGIAFFADISRSDLRQIADIVVEKRYDSDSVIIEEFTAAERFFIIVTGKVQISKRYEDGEQFILSVQSDGDFFGEMALLDEGPRSATARALEPTTVLEISRENFEKLLFKAPGLAFRLLKELSARLRETAALLVSNLQRRNRRQYQSTLEAMCAAIQAVEGRDAHARGRTPRILAACRAVGRRLTLPEEELSILELAALYHDVGMLAVPEGVLAKPGPLTPTEWNAVREHPRRSADMVMGIPLLQKTAPVILCHQEWFNGEGYPAGLSGERIPLPSRIILAVDALDALVSGRPYRGAVSPQEAAEEIRRGSGSQLDPQVADQILALIESGSLSDPR